MAHFLSFVGDQYIALSGADQDLESMDLHPGEEGEHAQEALVANDASGQAEHHGLREWVHRHLVEPFEHRH